MDECVAHIYHCLKVCDQHNSGIVDDAIEQKRACVNVCQDIFTKYWASFAPTTHSGTKLRGARPPVDACCVPQ